MKRSSHRPEGFSLVICLIILTLLAIITIGFIASSSLDRLTAHAFANKTGAEIAADTAVNQAMSLLADRIGQYPDSATVWEPMTPKGGGNAFEGTVLYYSDVPPNNPPANGATENRHVLPLVSLGLDANGQPLTDVPISSKADALGAAAWTNDNSIDMNRPRYNGDAAGWVGAPPAGRRPFYARWNNIQDQPAAGVTPRMIGRYAFWIEDESFKANLNVMGSTGRGQEATSPGTKQSEIPFQGMLRAVNPTWDLDTIASSATTLRDGFYGKRLFEARAYNQITAGSLPLDDQARFLATVYSGALNVSRHGSQRLNLNGLGIDKPTLADGEILKQIQQIVETVRYHAPNFSQRFYRLSQAPFTPKTQNSMDVATQYQDRYLYKIAANIRDYIDPDLQPTILMDSKTLAPRTAPVSALNADGSPIWAKGKDSGLFLQETACRYRTSVTSGSSGLTYDLKVDYYIEFWNMSTKDIAVAASGDTSPQHLGPKAFLRISNQQAWLTNSGTLLKATNTPAGDPIQDPTRDLVIDLTSGVMVNGAAAPNSTVLFKAGACTVITTDPDYLSPPVSGSKNDSPYSGSINLANTYYCPNLLNADRSGPGKREYTGGLPSSATGIKPDFRDSNQDYDTEVILGTDNGLIESHPAAVAMGSNIGPPVTTVASKALENWYGGSLFGNSPTPSELGDPRTNNEQIVYTRFLTGASVSEPDQSRYWNNTTAPRFSLGYPNDTYVNPSLITNGFIPWPDYYKGWVQTGTATATNPDKNTAPAYNADANLTSIGQLGDVFDPARVLGNKGTLGITGSRGGGRTFRIGQKDDLVDTTQVESANGGASQQWASWRLTDFMSTSSDIQLQGVININGVRRDNGAALRAASYGMKIHSVSRNSIALSATTTDLTLDNSGYTSNPPTELKTLIAQMTTRLSGTDVTKPTYFRERGELSDIAAFSSGIAGDIVPTVKMSEAFDHTREEFVRRIIDLSTTRGNIFSVYAIGESITQPANAAQPLQVTGIHEVKVTFALVPKKADGSLFQTTAPAAATGGTPPPSSPAPVTETFDPTDSAAIKQRFAKPDHYDIQLLQVAFPQSHP